MKASARRRKPRRIYFVEADGEFCWFPRVTAASARKLARLWRHAGAIKNARVLTFEEVQRGK